MRHSAGNTLAEYGLIGLLLLGICIVAITSLGNNLGGNLGNLEKSLARKPGGNTTQVAGVTNHVPRKKPVIPNAAMGGNALSATLANKMSVREMQATIQVSGANGATKELASVMAAYAKQLLVEGTLTEEQANLLSRLANEGHKLANAEKLLEDAYSQNMETVTYGGRTYTRKQFGEMFGFNRLHGVVGSTTSMDEQMKNAQSMTAPFLTIYNQAKSRGALDDPAVAKVIDTLSTEITITSDLLKWNLEEAEKSGRTTQEYQHRLGMGYVTALHQTNIFDQVTEIASEFTHNRSGLICSTGDGQDHGKQCTSQ